MALLPVANGTGAFSRFLNGQNISALDGDSNTPCAYRTSDFMHVGVWMPGTGNIGYGGLGYWPGSFVWLNGASSKVTFHELGHNLALGHASTISPGATTLNEYGEWCAHAAETHDWFPCGNRQCLPLTQPTRHACVVQRLLAQLQLMGLT